VKRPLRVLFVANDGLSAGHVSRALAIAGAMARRARLRDIETRLVLATTSEAHALLIGAADEIVTVRVPTPNAARSAGFSDVERRRLVRGTIEGLFDSFTPDLLVVDTFPCGPHGELEGLVTRASCQRALVRRHVPAAAARERGELTRGLDTYDLAIVAADPSPIPPTTLPTIPTAHVPPITLPVGCSSRDEARARLGLPRGRRVLLVAAGGGGDRVAVARAEAIASALTRLAPTDVVALAPGPLAPPRPPQSGAARYVIIEAAPLEPLLSAFDAAFAPAGYNTAHALAFAGVPAVLFARPRAFDDQAGRSERFARARFAFALGARDDEEELARALAWTREAKLPALEGGGADRAAEILLDLATSSTTSTSARETSRALA
jgi:UDP-N-acetylglucosamine--N-acetylmuramyl-(pentapeptide) pyrophosphoryl-undecaprenol N-acetylglucosamine transferase